MQIYWKKSSIYRIKEFDSHRVCLEHQQRCHFIVLDHQTWPPRRHLKALYERIVHNSSDWLAKCGLSSIEMTRRVWGNPSKHGKHLSSRVCTSCLGSFIQPYTQWRPLFSYKVFYSNVSETTGGDSAVISIDKFSLFCVSIHPFDITSSRHKYNTKQDLSMILIQLFLWKCNKVNKGQRVTFLISLLSVLYFWTPWAGMKRRRRFLEMSTLKYVRIWRISALAKASINTDRSILLGTSLLQEPTFRIKWLYLLVNS